MTAVQDHYERHLAPVYIWMAGGVAAACDLGAHDLGSLLDRPGTAVDLGAGFGMHSIPLARAGHQVLAIDTSEYLLTELRTHSVGLSVRAVAADLLDFRSHMGGLADLILCMGDTLTHLADHAQVEELMRDVARSLQPQGTFIATFRDYTRLPSGDDSFILVRSDTCRIHTCHLQDAGEHVAVSDVLHELVDGTWSMSVSTYKKLRLTPSAAVAAAENAGLRCIVRSGPRGMVELQASIAE